MGKLFLISVLVSSAVGCVTGTKHDYGNASINDPTLVAKVEKGKSTKADVKKILGDPAAVDFTDAGFEKWVYTYATSEIVSGIFNPKVDTRSKSLTVQFDKGGVVLNVGGGQTQGGLKEPPKEKPNAK